MDSREAVPAWAVDLQVTVARIDERSKQINNISEQLEGLRQSTVPLNEHTLLMQRVDQLWTRDLAGREAWDNMVPEHRTLWRERAEHQGAQQAHRIWLGALTVVVALLTAFTLLRGLGLNVSFGHG